MQLFGFVLTWCPQWCIKSFPFTMRYSPWWQDDPKWEHSFQPAVANRHKWPGGMQVIQAPTQMACPMGLIPSTYSLQHGVSLNTHFPQFPVGECDMWLSSDQWDESKMIHWVGILDNICTRDILGGGISFYCLLFPLSTAKTGTVTARIYWC